MIDRAIKRFGTDEPAPEQRRLTAGPVTATRFEPRQPEERSGRADRDRKATLRVR